MATGSHPRSPEIQKRIDRGRARAKVRSADHLGPDRWHGTDPRKGGWRTEDDIDRLQQRGKYVKKKRPVYKIDWGWEDAAKQVAQALAEPPRPKRRTPDVKRR